MEQQRRWGSLVTAADGWKVICNVCRTIVFCDDDMLDWCLEVHDACVGRSQ